MLEQVLEDYAAFADSMHGRWGTTPDGTKKPNLRVLMKPIINLFHGEPGCKKWKRMVDEHIKTSHTISELLQKTLVALPDRVLEAAPEAGPSVEYAIGDCPPPFQATSSASEEGEQSLVDCDAYQTRAGCGEDGDAGCQNGVVGAFANGLADVGR